MRLLCKLLLESSRLQMISLSIYGHLSSRDACSLQALYLRLRHLSYRHPETLCYLSKLAQLRHLSLSGRTSAWSQPKPAAPVDLAPLAALPQLQTLHMQCLSLQFLSPSGSLTWLTQLHELVLDSCCGSRCGQLCRVPLDFSPLSGITKLQIVSGPDGTNGLGIPVNLQQACCPAHGTERWIGHCSSITFCAKHAKHVSDLLQLACICAQLFSGASLVGSHVQ